jgi:uncharacterized protein YfiM (DUF2279 family)
MPDVPITTNGLSLRRREVSRRLRFREEDPVRVLRTSAALATAAGLLALVPLPAEAGAKPSCGRNKPCDTTPPVVSFLSPAAGSTIGGTIQVAGTATDNLGVASIALAVDGGAWVSASGTSTWSWSWNTAAVAGGTHTLTARATDAAGNTATSSRTLTVSNAVADITAPTLSIGSPAAGSTVGGTVSVNGSGSDNVGVTAVSVSVDGGAWAPAVGTSAWSWSWNTAGSLSSPAVGSTVGGVVTVGGTAGDNVGIAKVEVQTDLGAWRPASGTSAWSWSWDTSALDNGTHNLAARATDTAGNATVTSTTVTTSNTPTAGTCASTGAAPTDQLVSPEGLKIRICTALGGWTADRIYQMLRENAAAPGDFATIAPTLAVEVQDRWPSQTATSATTTAGRYTKFSALVYLSALTGGVFDSTPDYCVAHEYGHVWRSYYLYLARQGDWSSYLNSRWANADGSVRLGQVPELDSSIIWARNEIMASDYRLLFGSPTAIAQHPWSVNLNIPDPRQQPGLTDFLLNTWRTPV